MNCESMAESSRGVEASILGKTKREAVAGDMDSIEPPLDEDAVGEAGGASILTLSLYSISILARSRMLKVSQLKSIPWRSYS